MKDKRGEKRISILLLILECETIILLVILLLVAFSVHLQYCQSAVQHL